jgi:regulator of PEP synthase PpsR (kinase-PPPase family)
MINTYDIYLISDSTGETLERIFLAIKAQFKNFKYKTHFYSFTRTENQISKILEASKKNNNVIVLYTIVDNKLARHLSNECSLKNIPCFGILGDLIISFSKLLDQKALNVPSRQHIMDDEYYKKIEAIQFTMNHDDGNSVDDIEKSDIILLGVSRTSKTPTSIYLANKGMKISNIPLVNENSVPDILKKNPQKKCVVGLTAEPDRLVDLRKNRMQSIKDNESTEYTSLDTVQKEMEDARKLFQKYKWPSIDVTRKSVEETAASVLKIHDIFNQK